MVWVGLGISDKKKFRGDGICRQNKWLFPMEFRLFRGSENPRNSVPNPSAEQKTTRNSVPLEKNRSKLSEFPSEHFSRRENNPEFRSVEQIWKQTLGIPFRTIPRKRNLLRTKRGAVQNYKLVSEKTTFEVRTNHLVKLFIVFP